MPRKPKKKQESLRITVLKRHILRVEKVTVKHEKNVHETFNDVKINLISTFQNLTSFTVAKSLSASIAYAVPYIAMSGSKFTGNGIKLYFKNGKKIYIVYKSKRDAVLGNKTILYSFADALGTILRTMDIDSTDDSVPLSGPVSFSSSKNVCSDDKENDINGRSNPNCGTHLNGEKSP